MQKEAKCFKCVLTTRFSSFPWRNDTAETHLVNGFYIWAIQKILNNLIGGILDRKSIQDMTIIKAKVTFGKRYDVLARRLSCAFELNDVRVWNDCIAGSLSGDLKLATKGWVGISGVYVKKTY